MTIELDNTLRKNNRIRGVGAPKKLEFLNSLEKIYKNQISKTQNSIRAVDVRRETSSLEKRRHLPDSASRDNSVEEVKRPHSNGTSCLTQSISRCINARTSSRKPST